jgi:murein DD-endopeptidase MepM/ murein hydrolase activator NlpD
MGGVGGRFGRVGAPPTLEQLNAAIERLDERADIGGDIFTLVESRLFEARLQALLVPSSHPVDGPVGSGFGFRMDPFTGRAALHTGLDFPSDTGTAIHAAAGGMVIVSGPHPAYGNMIEIDHGNSLVTRYAHASKLLVAVGTLVKRGQKIAEVGTSGRSTGPHLHFEVMVAGVQQNPTRFLSGKVTTPTLVADGAGSVTKLRAARRRAMAAEQEAARSATPSAAPDAEAPSPTPPAPAPKPAAAESSDGSP